MYTILLALILSQGTPEQEVRLRGNVVCVDDALQESRCVEDSRYALRDGESVLHFFEPADPRVEMFADPRVRAMDLEIQAWIRDDKVEIVRVFSVRDGRLFHVHYFCDVCNITAYAGGLCWCCQQEFELRETPFRIPNPESRRKQETGHGNTEESRSQNSAPRV